MINTILSVIWPIKEFVNFIFHKTLGDYILNNLNLSYIEDEIKKNYEIVLSDLELNSYEINKKHFGSSPIKLLEGRIKKLIIKYPKNNEKIEIAIEDLYLTLMPIQNSERISKKKINAKSVFNKEENKENSIVANMLNKVLHNLEVSIKNTCVKICTYEIENNTRNNPTFTILIDLTKNDEIYYFNTLNDEKLNKLNNTDKKIERKERLFLINSDNSTILTVNNVDNDEYCSVMLKFVEDSPDNLKIQMDISNFEIILNSLQLHFIINFIEVCSIIFDKMKKKPNADGASSAIKTIKPKSTNEEIPFLKLLGFKLNNIIPCFNLNLLNVVLYQNKKNDFPRLWVFLDFKYPEKLDTFNKIQQHFMYNEDSFFIFNIRNIFVNSVKCLVNSTRSTEICFGDIKFNYNVFIQKFNKTSNKPDNNTNQTIHESKYVEASTYGSVYESIYNRADTMASNLKLRRNENSKDMIFMSMCESKEFFIKNYHTLINFNFKYDTFEILTISPNLLSDNSNSSFLELFSKSNYTVSIKILNKLINNDDKFKEKTIITVVFPTIKLDFHPILIINFTNLLFNNILLVNEIIYNDVSQSIMSKVFKKTDNNEKLNQKEKQELLNNEVIKSNKEEIVTKEEENDFMNSTIVVPNTSSDKDLCTRNKSSKKKIFVYFSSIAVNIYNFKKEEYDSYFKNIFHQYIEIVATNMWLNKKIDIIEYNQNYMNEIQNDDKLNIEIFNTEFFFKSKDNNINKDFASFFNFNRLLVLLKKNSLNYPLLEYTNHLHNFNSNYFTLTTNEEKSRRFSIGSSKNFITEIAEKKKNEIFESDNFQLFDIEKFEKKFYTQCENKFKKWSIRLKKKDSSKNDIISEMKQYYSFYNIDCKEFKEGETMNSNTINKIKIIISLGHINFFYENERFTNFIQFVDLLIYSLNMSKFFSSGIRNINKELKVKALKIFDLCRLIEVSSEPKIKSVIVLETVIKSINLILCKKISPIKDIIQLNIEKEMIYKFIIKPFLKIGLHNIKILLCQYSNEYKEILLSMENAKILLRKNDYKKDDILRSFYFNQGEDEMFNHILYKGCQEENISLICILVKIKENVSNNNNNNDLYSQFFNQNFYEKQLILFNDFLDFIEKNRIKTNDQSIKVLLTANHLVLSPFFEQFDINYLVELKKEISDYEEENEKIFEKIIDFKKYQLFTINKVINCLNRQISTLELNVLN